MARPPRTEAEHQSGGMLMKMDVAGQWIEMVVFHLHG